MTGRLHNSTTFAAVVLVLLVALLLLGTLAATPARAATGAGGANPDDRAVTGALPARSRWATSSRAARTSPCRWERAPTACSHSAGASRSPAASARWSPASRCRQSGLPPARVEAHRQALASATSRWTRPSVRRPGLAACARTPGFGSDSPVRRGVPLAGRPQRAFCGGQVVVLGRAVADRLGGSRQCRRSCWDCSSRRSCRGRRAHPCGGSPLIRRHRSGGEPSQRSYVRLVTVALVITIVRILLGDPLGAHRRPGGVRLRVHRHGDVHRRSSAARRRVPG